MKKSLLWIIVFILSMSVVATFSLAGCKDEAEEVAEEEVEEVEEEVEEEEAPAEEEVVEEEKAAPGTYTMRIGHTHGIDMPRHLSLLMFEQLVEKDSEGAIVVEVYPLGQLGSEAEMVESVKMGTLEASRAGMFDLVANELSAYMMPFLFNSQEDFVKIADGPIGEEIAAAGLKNGVAILATGDAGGLRQWTNNVRPIKTPEDMEGLKMRTPGVEAIIKIIEAIGGNPVAIDYGELYMALKTGVADGEENPIVNIYDKKFYEVQKYITMSNYQIHPDPFYVSSIWFDALPAYLQDIVVDASREMMIYSNKLMLEKEAAFFPTIEENMEVTYLTDEERQVFIDKTSSVVDYFVGEGWFSADLIQGIRDELK